MLVGPGFPSMAHQGRTRMGRWDDRRGPEARRRIGGGGDSRERECGSKSRESGGSAASCAPCTGKSVVTNTWEEDTGKVAVADAWPIYIEEEGHGDRGNVRGGTRADTEASTSAEEGVVDKREVGGGRARFEVGVTSKRELQVACQEAGSDGEGDGQGL